MLTLQLKGTQKNDFIKIFRQEFTAWESYKYQLIIPQQWEQAQFEK